jgi:hypothetical protein
MIAYKRGREPHKAGKTYRYDAVAAAPAAADSVVAADRECERD